MCYNQLFFDRNRQCDMCELSATATNPCLPTKAYKVTGKDKALVIVGEAPGYHEDRGNDTWIGKTGQLMISFIEAAKFADYADVYLANACRCLTPMGVKPTKTQVRTCRKYLKEDIKKISEKYNGNVTILACGSHATIAVSEISSVTEAISCQGTTSSSLLLEQDTETSTSNTAPVVFFTYHPAILFAGRSPGKVHAVEQHFHMVVRHLSGEETAQRLVVEPKIGYPAPPIENLQGRMVSMDIESYGILKGVEQTSFHPVKCKAIDGIDYSEQPVTMAFACRIKGKEHIQSYQYVWSNPNHRIYIRQWMSLISDNGLTMLGQNIKFDILMLSYADKVLNYFLRPCRMKIEDLMLMSFLLYDQQAEKGLKELALLYGIMDYKGLDVTGKLGAAKNPCDKRLWYYNSLDAVVTLKLYEDIEEKIKAKYGKDCSKFTQCSEDMRNQVLWDAINLERAGITFNTDMLKSLEKKEKEAFDTLLQTGKDRGYILSGTGSKKDVTRLMWEGVNACGLNNDTRLVYTEKTKVLSGNKVNRNLIMKYLEDEELRDTFNIYNELEEHKKLVTSFINPLLHNKRKGIVETICKGVKGMAYPGWFPIPSYAGKNKSSYKEENKMGGTKQGRISCSRPGAQTFPPVITKALCSRWEGGVLKSYDSSQIELRITAFLSGDKKFIGVYEKGEDLHTRTGQILYPDLDRTVKEWKESEERQLGKTLNFLIVYRGGAETFQNTARRDLGLELEYDFCAQCIRRWDIEYYVCRQWQDDIISEAKRAGRLTLPTGWTRTFGVGEDPPVNEICNFPVQTISAQLIQSAQYAIAKEMERDRLYSVICLQVYDSVVVDIYPGEEKKVDAIVAKYLTKPPLMYTLEDIYGRTIPLEFEAKYLGCSANERVA